MAVAIHNTVSSGSFTAKFTASRRSMQARPTQIRQGLAPAPAQRSRVQNPLMQPRTLEQQQQRGTVCQGLFGLGLPEVAVIAGVAALIFGPSKLPELGKGLGKTVKSFQTAAKEFKTELEQAASEGDDGATANKDAAAAGSKEAASKRE